MCLWTRICLFRFFRLKNLTTLWTEKKPKGCFARRAVHFFNIYPKHYHNLLLWQQKYSIFQSHYICPDIQHTPTCMPFDCTLIWYSRDKVHRSVTSGHWIQKTTIVITVRQRNNVTHFIAKVFRVSEHAEHVVFVFVCFGEMRDRNIPSHFSRSIPGALCQLVSPNISSIHSFASFKCFSPISCLSLMKNITRFFPIRFILPIQNFVCSAGLVQLFSFRWNLLVVASRHDSAF